MLCLPENTDILGDVMPVPSASSSLGFVPFMKILLSTSWKTDIA